jgi:transposase
VKHERDRLRREIERSSAALEAARRDGFRQAAPFARARRQGTRQPPGRRAGRDVWSPRSAPRPPEITETHEASLPSIPTAAARCGGSESPSSIKRTFRSCDDALCAQVRGSPVVSPDDTGWKVAGRLHWLWAFATPDTTVYAIQPGRGFAEAAAMFGARLRRRVGARRLGAVSPLTHATHQTCLARLPRRCRLLRPDHPRSPFAPRVQTVLQQALALPDRRVDGTISARGLAVARGRLLTALLLDQLTTQSTIPAVQRFAAHLRTEAAALLTFLGDPAVNATNWRAEHAIRPAVVMRTVCGGSRSTRGATTTHVLASVLRTTHQRGLNATDTLVALLRASGPIVPPELQDGLQ